MKKKINIQFLIITLLAILTTVSLSIFVFYELFKQEVMADLKTHSFWLKRMRGSRLWKRRMPGL